MSRPLKILITGQHGQVSLALQQKLQGLGELIVLGRDQLDLTNVEQIRQQVRTHRPGLIINAAAHTAVDQAESEPDAAFAINAIAPGLLAEEARALGIPLIHYSTDYVFDGSKPAPYTEADVPNPLGVYGQSKLAGEQAIAAVGGQYLILRTSWVYSSHGKNFLLTMQRLLQEKPQMRIVADQIGAPTWAGTIANSTRTLIERWQAGQAGDWGIYHLTAQGETSWFGFAQAIGEHLRAAGKPCAELEAIPSSAYPTPAKRPLNSRLDCSRLRQQWQVGQPQWQDALRECLAEQH
ncbi:MULTISPECIES: dTDP-4-dehydrorhamnose reductase [unclassified Pseudomonas]|jgi:dTDP-4-dehydrorhamnose reductase|uniref:dTDP-4-dehydrorhamnose reductase n=1 Tax=Pseudomonas gorinensis TaxID=3240790 RepID=A0ACA7NZ54_9PSED|nr:MULTISPECIES: dTDP-4-dehydrorhamnose reductase [unclassified Pseudomonas]AHC32899.1 dTDP-4-dehydrorhamnose reductase [Pseudomonas sp. TKP]MBL1308730.1 dTDP-4-dehydrorhamnose reductase [Pseudomonas sp.]PMX06639.1 dTDP-4-dehydrorhamnose reductase [Pseudomonas sp. MPBC4-3]PMX43993.1 dTDP-4-dehydrorhamnose reductase [Pseudomonas sp. FW301-21B01]PMY06709.1 dTDP-4-dehydrorhamnose reductase [Pseudomonas sp. MPR-R5A]